MGMNRHEADDGNWKWIGILLSLPWLFSTFGSRISASFSSPTSYRSLTTSLRYVHHSPPLPSLGRGPVPSGHETRGGRGEW